MIKYIYIYLFLIYTNLLHAQTKYDYIIESNNLISNQVPFWMLNNQNGKYNSKDITTQLSTFFKANNSISSSIKLEYGAELLLGQKDYFRNELHFYQYYANIKTNDLELNIGKHVKSKKNIDLLRSGNLLESNNAEPIPKVQIKTSDYIALPYLNDNVEIKAMIAHGWLESQRYVESPYLHEKYGYIKVKNILPFDLYVGLQHAAIWGGTHPVYGKLPETWSVFKDVFFANAGNDETSPIALEQENRTGNHLGLYDLGMNYQYGEYNFLVYRQILFEDASGKHIQFFSDGLWGLEIKLNEQNTLLNGLVFEFIKTDYQSGPIHDVGTELKEDRLFGNDNYYNNDLYHSGWSYYGFTIGNPFITSPIFNFRNSLTTKDGKTIVSHFPNNRVLAWHIGLMGALSQKINYRWLISYSLNYGYYYSTEEDYNEEEVTINGKTYIIRELPGLNQFSTMFELDFPITFLETELRATTRVALDVGELLGDRYGIFVGLSKHGIF